MDKPFRLLPELTQLSRPFWTNGFRGSLAVLRCGYCGYYIHPPVPRCPACLSQSVEPAGVSGNARVATYTVNHHSWNPTMPERYVIALVELVEQPDIRLMTNIVHCDPNSVYIGMPVQVVFEEDEDVALPLFEPDTETVG
ncbi:MAG: DNA-binding protein [Actinophytocola sp.]|nr:DNA-binding protein [Actinophytocola sp.]